jgi:hypothetical protein
MTNRKCRVDRHCSRFAPAKTRSYTGSEGVDEGESAEIGRSVYQIGTVFLNEINLIRRKRHQISTRDKVLRLLG